jgi:hypothetical protein
MKGNIYPKTENFVGAEGSPDVGAIISAGGEAVGAIIGALATVKDGKLRRQYQERIAVLDAQEQRDLNAKLLKAKNDSEKTRILAETLNATNVARIQAFNKKDLNVALYLIGAIAILGSALYIYKKFKK